MHVDARERQLWLVRTSSRRSCSLVRHEASAAGPPWLCQQHGWQRRWSLHRGMPTNLKKPSSSLAALRLRATRAGSWPN